MNRAFMLSAVAENALMKDAILRVNPIGLSEIRRKLEFSITKL